MSGALAALVREYWQVTRDDDTLVAAAAGDPALLWRVLLALVDAAPDDGALAVLGAGAIEAFIDAHGDTVVSRLDADLARHPRLLVAMASTWLEGEQSGLNVRVQLALARTAAAREARGQVVGTRLVTDRLYAPGPPVLIGDRLFWVTAADYRSPDPWLCLSAACAGGDVRVHGAPCASHGLAVAAGALHGVGSCGVWRLDAAGGEVDHLVVDETLGNHLVVVGDNLYWNVSSLVRTVPREGGKPRSLLVATSPKSASGVAVIASLASDGSSLYWSQLGTGEIVRALPDTDERLVCAVEEADPRGLQVHGDELYWLAGGAPGRTQIRRMARQGSPPVTIVDTNDAIAAFSVDDTERHVYWLDATRGALERTPLARTSHPGGASERVASGLAGARHLVLDLDEAYVTVDDAILAVPI
jgi:hypothetical protein